MPIPESFTPAAISAGVLTNIATDILEHHAQALEGTLAGRMLKLAGLIEPNFDDRLRDTLSKALRIYFETHPNYKIGRLTNYPIFQSANLPISQRNYARSVLL